MFRKYGKLFPDKRGDHDRPKHDQPELFTAYLNSNARVNVRRRPLGFSVDPGMLVPDYEMDRALWLKDHFLGGYIFRDKLNLEAIPPTDNEMTRVKG